MTQDSVIGIDKIVGTTKKWLTLALFSETHLLIRTTFIGLKKTDETWTSFLVNFGRSSSGVANLVHFLRVYLLGSPYSRDQATLQ